MKLLTPDMRKQLPALGAQEETPDPIIHFKFFTPDAGWTWFVTEGGEEEGDFLFFGFVVGVFPEWGYFRLSELESIRGVLGLPVERDLFFKPRPFSELKNYERGEP